MNQNLKIFTIYCKQNNICNYIKNNSSIFIPIYCGIPTKQIENLKEVDFIENLAEYNTFINESSGIYTIGKNFKFIEEKYGLIDFIGFNHYRRYLNINYSDLLSKDTIICYDFNRHLNMSLITQYRKCHNEKPFHMVIDTLKIFFKEIDEKILLEWFNQKKFYSCNMFIMSKELFFNFFNFYEKAILICISLINSGIFKNEDQRLFAFILERITSFWIWFVNKKDIAKILCIDMVKTS